MSGYHDPTYEGLFLQCAVEGGTEIEESRLRRETHPTLAAYDAMHYKFRSEHPQAKSPKLSADVVRKLRAYAASGRRDDAEGTTFVYIVDFLATGGKAYHSRLFVASADFNVPVEDLAKMAAAGYTAQALADKIAGGFAD